MYIHIAIHNIYSLFKSLKISKIIMIMQKCMNFNKNFS